MLTWYIVQLLEPLLTVNDSIRIKRNDISKKETKNKKNRFFLEKYQKNSKSQVTWPHNGYFYNIVKLFEPLSTVNDSIGIKRNEISKKETKNQKIDFFWKVSKKF